MKLEELQVYQLAMEMAEKIWNIVMNWNYFEKDTVRKQLVKAADSIAANLSEVLVGFFIKKINNSVIIQEVHYLRPKLG